MPEAAQVFLIRHLPSQTNRLREKSGVPIMAGQFDAPLAGSTSEDFPDLQTQIEFVVNTILVSGIYVFSSGLIRATQTAQLLLARAGLNLAINQDIRFQEKTYGDFFDGKEITVLEQFHPIAVKKYRSFHPQTEYWQKMQHRHDIYDQNFFNTTRQMESDWQVVDRTLQALEYLSSSYPGKRIAVFTHGTVMRLLLSYVARDYTPFTYGAIKNLASIELQVSDRNISVQETNGVTAQV